MQIKISQSRQFKIYSIVYVAKDAISYNCLQPSCNIL